MVRYVSALGMLFLCGCTGALGDLPSYRLSHPQIIEALKGASGLLAYPADQYEFRVESTFLKDVLPDAGEEIVAFIECRVRNASASESDNDLAVIVLRRGESKWTVGTFFRVPVWDLCSKDNGSVHFMDVNGDGLADIVGCGHSWHKQECAAFSTFVAIPALPAPVAFSTPSADGWVCPLQKIAVLPARDGAFQLALLTLTLQSGSWSDDTLGYAGGRVYTPQFKIEVFAWSGGTMARVPPEKDHENYFHKEIEAVRQAQPFEENPDEDRMAAQVPWPRGCMLLRSCASAGDWR